MKENLSLSLIYILNDEGGFAERKAEPGGAVNRGISLEALAEDWNKNKRKSIPTVNDLNNLSEEEAMRIYTDHYAKSIGFDDLPVPLDYVMLNTAVMEGITGANELLFLSKAKTPIETAANMLIFQLAKKLKKPSRDKFGPGWADRIMRVWARARSM